jgi:Anthranilate/para-aminobenzoate synthases component I
MTAMAQVSPTLGEFIKLAKQGNVIPVFAEFHRGWRNAVSAFKKLDRGVTVFLFESTEKNDVSGRFSFVGVDARVVLQSYGREVRIIEDGNQRRLETSSDPLDEVRKLKTLSVRFAPRIAAVCRRRCRIYRLRGNPLFRAQSSVSSKR